MIVFIAMLFSCRNDLKTVEAFDVSDSIPSQIIKNVVMYRSDSGYIKAKITSKLVHNFEDKNKRHSYTIFPEGVEVKAEIGDKTVAGESVLGYLL